jgi:putative ABC transport system substrate-binding protein
MSIRSAASILCAAAGLLLAAPEAQAQPAVKVARIGYLSTLSANSDTANREAFRKGLAALGYVEGQNALIEARHANGNLERLPELANEIVRANPDVIVAATTPAVRAVQRATAAIPVVMAFAGDPAGDGLVASLPRPGGNTTGLSAAVTEIAAKRVEFLHAVVPKATRFVLLATPTASNSMVSATEQAGRVLGARVVRVPVRDAADVTRALTESNARVDGVIVDLAIQRNVAQILELAGKRKLPTVSGPGEFAVRGGLLAYGADYPDLFRRAAAFVDKILKGARPAELPVEQPTKFVLIVNLNTAKALGLKIPPALLARADEVIQ